MAFLLECLDNLDEQFRKSGGRLNMLLGDPVTTLTKLAKYFDIVQICFDQDPEALWLERDNAVKNFCGKNKIKIVESIGDLSHSASVSQSGGSELFPRCNPLGSPGDY